MPNKVVVITGPTASGKTRLGIALAKIYDGEIVSADSMQIYQHMDIGTAKPTEEEKEGIVHHMMDIVSPFENYSVSRFVSDASKVTDDILSRGKLPIIVGGTGLYIESLLAGRTFMSYSDNGIRQNYSEMYDSLGGEKMLEKLSEFDRYSSEKLHFNDKKRIVRAFEVYAITGKTISQHNAESKTIPPRYDAAKIALTYKNRSDLYSMIDRRVDIMMECGLENEVRSLIDMGLDSRYTSMQAIGYKEMLEYIQGERTLAEVIDIIKMESRRYAKRQLSWLGRYDDLNWIFWDNPPDFDSGLLNSTSFLANMGIIKP